MNDVFAFVVRHGEAIVFAYVFADQLGVPLPAVPFLLAMGALAAVGQISFPVALLLCVVACVLADSVWFTLGRVRGRDVLRLLCKISLEPDSCVRRTEDVFGRFGVRSLLFAKFIPGLGTIAPPLAGMVGVSVPRFAIFSALGGFVWAGAWSSVGYLAGDALQQVTAQTDRIGNVLVVLVVVAAVGYVVVKWIQRRRFLRSLHVARISPDMLKLEIESGQPVFIVDLRSALDVSTTPVTIPGALRIEAETLERDHHAIPRDRDIVLYCS